MLKILDELNAEGKTVIIVTHDMNVARRAGRIIEIADGVIVADRVNAEKVFQGRRTGRHSDTNAEGIQALRMADRFREAFAMALLALKAHRLRTFLTMLGIIIGIASVVCVVALAKGRSARCWKISRALAQHTGNLSRHRFGDLRSNRVTTLVVADADALAGIPMSAR